MAKRVMATFSPKTVSNKRLDIKGLEDRIARRLAEEAHDHAVSIAPVWGDAESERRNNGLPREPYFDREGVYHTGSEAPETGVLKSSIRRTRKLKNGRYRVVTDQWYAKFVEGGTRFMEARPFMKPAAEYVRRNANRIAREEIRKR